MRRVLPRSAALSTSAFPAGLTLVEVLMSMLVAAIGVMSVIVLLPLSFVRSVQATNLTNGTILRYNAESQIQQANLQSAVLSPWQAGQGYQVGDAVSLPGYPQVWMQCTTGGISGAALSCLELRDPVHAGRTTTTAGPADHGRQYGDLDGARLQPVEPRLRLSGLAAQHRVSDRRHRPGPLRQQREQSPFSLHDGRHVQHNGSALEHHHRPNDDGRRNAGLADRGSQPLRDRPDRLELDVRHSQHERTAGGTGKCCRYDRHDHERVGDRAVSGGHSLERERRDSLCHAARQLGRANSGSGASIRCRLRLAGIRRPTRASS